MKAGAVRLILPAMSNADRLRLLAGQYRSRAETAGSPLEREGWIKLAKYVEAFQRELEDLCPAPRPRYSC